MSVHLTVSKSDHTFMDESFTLFTFLPAVAMISLQKLDFLVVRLSVIAMASQCGFKLHFPNI
jgi:hypothetical protein